MFKYTTQMILLAALVAIGAQMHAMHAAQQAQAAKLVELETFVGHLTDTIMEMQDDAPSEF